MSSGTNRCKSPPQNYAESTATFPQKLYALMGIEEGPIIKWVHHGYAFVIIDQAKFLDEIVPKYFKRKFKTVFIPTLAKNIIQVNLTLQTYVNRHQSYQFPETVKSLWISKTD